MMAQRYWNLGTRTAYVDLNQVGFLRPNPTDLSLSAANLGVIWRNSLARGAQHLIADGTFTTREDVDILRHAVRPASVHVTRLTAAAHTLYERLESAEPLRRQSPKGPTPHSHPCS